MATTVSLHQLEDLATAESKSEIFLQTNTNIELHIIAKEDYTIIKLPFGNKFDVVDGCIIVKQK